ncbi:MAG: bifunctional 3-deoxy-7-phosphoheptulonate synthase/chorismate mutase type II [Paramuribaculum sp.]|nr:bifunctional 3-deoxy-7-phosphoheptulonate synthase/chorismate mutase type II [Paramuribaculum sp.]
MKDLLPIASYTSTPIIIAGPCSAESREQMLTTARALKAEGISIFRAGAWKPRTSPGTFAGVGAVALEWLNDVKNETGMLTATEVANHTHVSLALQAGIDILWIGARTTANPFAMQEIADTLAERGATDVAVLVKNPINPELELWIGALQRIYNAGIRRLGAIHRGFSVYGHHLYRNVPQWDIPIELHLRYPELPIFCDPSHIGGKRELIEPLSQEALNLGYDGLIVETHCDPDNALSDSAQQITPRRLAEIILRLHKPATLSGSENLAALRARIDTLDTELLKILSQRMEVCREIGRYKRDNNMKVVQAERYNDVISSRIAEGVDGGLGEDFVRRLLLSIHDESVRQQIRILKD